MLRTTTHLLARRAAASAQCLLGELAQLRQARSKSAAAAAAACPQPAAPQHQPPASQQPAASQQQHPAQQDQQPPPAQHQAQQQQQQQTQQPAMERRPLAPPGFSRTFYKRQLPSPPAIEFASDRGKQVFADALADSTMNNFFKLIEQFRTQDEPAYCGLASLAMTLNTLSIDPRRTWKGPWRWFHEEMLDCCHPLPKVREEGITLTQAACLARCNGARVEVYPHGSSSLEEFRGMVAEVCRSAEEHIIVSYSRKEFLQTGDGHFSPIGGYSAREDLVLILDTARFKYPPHWVPLHMLYDAMAHVDPATGRPRGFMRMGRHPRLDSVLFTLDVRDAHWREANRYILEQMAQVAAAAAAAPGATAESVLAAAAAAAPLPALRKFVAVRTAGSSTHGGVCIQTAAVHTFLRELRGMALFGALAGTLPPPRSLSSGSLDEVLPSNCYTNGGCGEGEGCCAPAPAAEQQAASPPGSPCALLDAQQQEQERQLLRDPPEDSLAATAAACSSPALAASAAEPAVREDLSRERAAMLLLMSPREVWREIGDERLRGEVLALLDTAAHSVVTAEVEYLSAQLWQLLIMQLPQSEASGHQCGGDHCGHAEHADDGERPGGSGAAPSFSDGDEQQRLALMLSSIT